ncbi:selenide, water dikinase domain protein [Mycobacterium kansasii]|uniref:Selenide, water dikinase domain protein n=1 Tax=Mycobacterium kansasii TaxID=1768 RepID=A0A1V3XBM9_MYCKA|nr:selenide, water dikinase domain protein [Mycobacterium kansasii]
MDAMPYRLTQYAHGGGCACKIPPGELEDVVGRLGQPRRTSRPVSCWSGWTAATTPPRW